MKRAKPTPTPRSLRHAIEIITEADPEAMVIVYPRAEDIEAQVLKYLAQRFGVAMLEAEGRPDTIAALERLHTQIRMSPPEPAPAQEPS